MLRCAAKIWTLYVYCTRRVLRLTVKQPTGALGHAGGHGYAYRNALVNRQCADAASSHNPTILTFPHNMEDAIELSTLLQTCVCLVGCLSVRRAGVFLTQFITTGYRLLQLLFLLPAPIDLHCIAALDFVASVTGVVVAFVAILMCLSTSCFLSCYYCCCVVSVAAIARTRLPFSFSKRLCSVCSPHCLSVAFCQSVCLSIWFAFGVFCC